MGTAERTLIFIILSILLVLFGFLAWYFSHRARHKETLKRIEMGIDKEELKTSRREKFPWLKIGIVIIGVSIGLAIVAILSSKNISSGSGAFSFSVLGICSGISFIVANYITDESNR